MNPKNVYINDTLVGRAATWSAVYLLLSEKSMSFVGAHNATEGPTAFFLRGRITQSDPSKPALDVRARSNVSAHRDISERTKAIAQGLINTKRAKSPQLDDGMLRLEGLNSCHYWISLDGRQVLRGKSYLEADELGRQFIEDMESAGR